MARLQELYHEKVVPDLIEKFGYKSPMQVPRITKITLNMGVWRSGRRQEDHRQRRRRPDQDRRPEAGRHQGAARRSPASRSAKAIRSAAWSRCAACACTSSWTVS